MSSYSTTLITTSRTLNLEAFDDEEVFLYIIQMFNIVIPPTQERIDLSTLTDADFVYLIRYFYT